MLTAHEFSFTHVNDYAYALGKTRLEGQLLEPDNRNQLERSLTSARPNLSKGLPDNKGKAAITRSV